MKHVFLYAFGYCLVSSFMLALFSIWFAIFSIGIWLCSTKECILFSAIIAAFLMVGSGCLLLFPAKRLARWIDSKLDDERKETLEKVRKLVIKKK